MPARMAQAQLMQRVQVQANGIKKGPSGPAGKARLRHAVRRPVGRNAPTVALFDGKVIPGLRAEGRFNGIEFLEQKVQQARQFFGGQGSQDFFGIAGVAQERKKLVSVHGMPLQCAECVGKCFMGRSKKEDLRLAA